MAQETGVQSQVKSDQRLKKYHKYFHQNPISKHFHQNPMDRQHSMCSVCSSCLTFQDFQLHSWPHRAGHVRSHFLGRCQSGTDFVCVLCNQSKIDTNWKVSIASQRERVYHWEQCKHMWQTPFYSEGESNTFIHILVRYVKIQDYQKSDFIYLRLE